MGHLEKTQSILISNHLQIVLICLLKFDVIKSMQFMFKFQMVNHDTWCYLMENPGKSISDWNELGVDEKMQYNKRPVRIKGEGIPGKFYFRITSPKYQLVEITPSNASHHYTLCFESV